MNPMESYNNETPEEMIEAESKLNKLIDPNSIREKLEQYHEIKNK